MKLTREDFVLIKECISIMIEQRLRTIEVYISWDSSNILLLGKFEKELEKLVELKEKLK